MRIWDIFLGLVDWICVKFSFYYEWKNKTNRTRQSKKLHNKLHKYDDTRFNLVKNVKEMKKMIQQQKKEK